MGYQKKNTKHVGGSGADAAVAWILGLVAVGCIWLPFQNLTDSSLWSDELATVYISGPNLSLPVAYTTRMLQDVNPPLYYLIQHFWLQVFSDFTLGSRLLSTFAAIGSIVVLALIGGRNLSAPARALLAAAPVTSFAFIHFSTEARGYSVALLIGSGQVILFQRILDGIRQRRSVDNKHILALGLLSVLNGLTHHYGLFYSCALVGVLCLYALFAGNVGVLVRLVASGLVFSGANVAYTLTALRFTEFRSDVGWIPSDIGHLEQSLKEFFWLGAGGHHGGALLILAIIALGVMAVLSHDPGLRRRAIASGLPHFLVVLVVVMLSIAVSLIVQPSTTYRYLLISSPSIWWGTAQFMDVMLREGRPYMRRISLAAMLVATLWGVPFAILSGDSNREDWRASAKFVGQIEACKNSQIPVYADAGMGSVPLFSLYLNPDDRQTPTHVNSYEPAGPCPVLLWAVHGLEDPPVEAAEKAGGRVVRFEHIRAWDCWLRSCRLLNREKDVGAIVVLRADAKVAAP